MLRKHVAVPSSTIDLRANVAQSFAVAHGAACAEKPSLSGLLAAGGNADARERARVAAGSLAAPSPGGPPPLTTTTTSSSSSSSSSGLAGYDAEAEFQRQGLNNPLSHWRVTNLNATYNLCQTYPRFLVVPRSLTDDDLVTAAKFRSARRLPILCWKDPFGVASICRHVT